MDFNLSYSVAFVLSTFTVYSSGQVLQVPEVIQERTEWCWAAASDCVLKYYGKEVTQCIIAEYARTHVLWHDFGSGSCCGDPESKCNYPNYNFGFAGSIQEILEQWNVGSYGLNSPLSFDKIKLELEEGRPFIIRFELGTSGGHFVVGHGIVDSTIYYMDPWPGEGYKIASYEWVLSNEKQYWQGTNIITTNPVPETVELLLPEDRSVNQSCSPVLKWRSSTAPSYRIQCAMNESFANPLRDTIVTKNTFYHLYGLTSSTMYYWRVCGVDTIGNCSEYSAIMRFSTEQIVSVVNAGKTTSEISTWLNRNGLQLSYSVTSPSRVTINIHSLQGKLYRTIFNGFQQEGQYVTQCKSKGLPSGNYILSVCIGKSSKNAMLTLVN